MIELRTGGSVPIAPSPGRPRQGLGRDREGEMRSLSRHGGTGTQIQPLTTHLPQGIGTALGGGSLLCLPRAALGIHHGPERRQQDLAGLRIEVSVHPHHAAEGGGGMQAPSCPKLRLGIGTGLRGDRLAPVPHHPG